MIKVDSVGQEYCLPCADNLEIEGVIVEREGECLECNDVCDECGYKHDTEEIRIK